LRYVSGLDTLIVTGSGVLSDHSGGVSNFPYTLFKWSILSKATRTKLAFVSVGAGPLNSAISRLLVKVSLWLADYRSFRDQSSKQLIERIGVRGDNPIYPDLANGLEIPLLRTANDHSRPVVGVNLFPHYDNRYWAASDLTVYQRYINTMADFVSWLIQNKYIVAFFPTQFRADPPVIEDLKNALAQSGNSPPGDQLIEMPVRSVEELLKLLSLTDLVVATRFHGIVLSFLMNKPVVALSNHHKMVDLMLDMGQADYLLNIDTFTSEMLIDRFKFLEINCGTAKRQIAQKIEVYRRDLEQQYDIFLNGLVGCDRVPRCTEVTV